MTTETSISSISGGNLVSVNKSINRGTNAKERHGLSISSDKIENLQLHENCVHPTGFKKLGARLLSYIFCGPCIEFLKNSSAFRKMLLTSVTLLVTALLVASPILFLISAAPSLPHHHREDCAAKSECVINSVVAECTEETCKNAAKIISSKINWTSDVCNDFKTFCCSDQDENLEAFKSPQEIVDQNVLELLIHNTTSGPFRQLGRLFNSCLKVELNSSSIRFVVEELGGFLPPHSIPYSVTPLMTKIMKKFGAPLPLFDVYHDLSYGRRPQILMIIDIPMDVNKILQNPIRWKAPKSPSFKIVERVPKLFNKVVDFLLPQNMSQKQKELEKTEIENFIIKLNQLRKDYSRIDRDFSNSYVTDNISSLIESYPFLSWNELLTASWRGPIVLKSPKYLNELEKFLKSQHNRVIHNSLLTLFILNILPDGEPSPIVCAKATMSILPEACSSLYLSQFSDKTIRDAISRSNTMFDLLKSNLKRAPNLRGAALVRLSSLKMQAEPWPLFYNQSAVLASINELEISSDNWIQNILKIYNQHKILDSPQNFTISNVESTWAFPIISKAFYNSLNHKIVVPLSLILAPYFHASLPPYLHFSTVGTTISKEILRSITKNFEEKSIKCVPSAVNVFSNYSRMELLIASGGFQIAYHSMLSLSGSKAMQKLPGLNLTSTQIFFLVTAQEFSLKSQYEGIETDSIDFHDILLWLFAQGGIASQHFNCKYGTAVRVTQNCGIW